MKMVLKEAKHKRVSLPAVMVFVLVALSVIGFVAAAVSDDSLEEVADTGNIENVENAPEFDDSFEFTAEDCTSFEQFDPAEKECFYECDTDEECERIEAQIDAELNSLFEDVDFSTFSDGERPENTEGLSTFTILNGRIQGSGATLQDQEIWDIFVQIAPEDMVQNEIVGYETYIDSSDGTAAYVAPDESDPTTWILGVNHDSMYQDGVLDRAEAIRTLIHEMAHILTLGNSQVPADSFGGACGTIELQEGCANSDSYIAAFNSQFWASIRDSWPGQDASEDELFDFYDANQDQFVSDYAATNLGEDVAESFTSFVVQGRASGGEIKDQKINFFYDYAELVRLRDTIRQNIAL